MYSVFAYFDYHELYDQPVPLLTELINAWRYNGQIISREVAITHQQASSDSAAKFSLHLATPEQDSLLENYNNDVVNQMLAALMQIGLHFSAFEVIGRDYNADETSHHHAPRYQILYTTFLNSCSPVYNGEDFSAIPLYRLALDSALRKRIIQWQEDWQACDQLQMNGVVLESATLQQIAEQESELAQIGQQLCREIEQQTQIPTYYYLYRLGTDPQLEHSRTCPSCQQAWRLSTPLHELFQFKCDKCRLISNLSWEIQG